VDELCRCILTTKCDMWGSEYRCDRCGVVASVSTRMVYYRLDDGAPFPCIDQPAWCFDCNAVRAAERLPEMDRLAALVHDLEEFGLDDKAKEDAQRARQDEGSLLREKLQLWHAALRWRTARRSPPRCLECGSVSIKPLVPNPEDSLDSFEHPGCNGRFRIENSWHGIQASCRVLNAEGLPWTDEP
jgi:hypothetical protein